MGRVVALLQPQTLSFLLSLYTSLSYLSVFYLSTLEGLVMSEAEQPKELSRKERRERRLFELKMKRVRQICCVFAFVVPLLCVCMQ